MIELVGEKQMAEAAKVYTKAWQESHKDICSEAFLKLHGLEYRRNVLEQEQKKGAKIYLLTEREPVGIVSVFQNEIVHLYILSEYQKKGCGTVLLSFAVEQCRGEAWLWILETNQGARKFYERNGFCITGKRELLNNGIAKLEMKYAGLHKPENILERY